MQDIVDRIRVVASTLDNIGMVHRTNHLVLVDERHGLLFAHVGVSEFVYNIAIASRNSLAFISFRMSVGLLLGLFAQAVFIHEIGRSICLLTWS
jgi:hypothetical protein